VADAADAPRDRYARERELFLDAYARVDQTGQAARTDAEALRSYPLYPYLQAARIRRALADAAGPLGAVDERAAQFLRDHEREPVARSLRQVWLTSLAERRQWSAFLEGYDEDEADNALRCHSYTARIELGRTADLESDIAARWLTPRSLPDCERAFEWMRARGALTPELIEQRVKRALEENNTGFARQIAATLPQERRAPWLQWAALLEQPQRQIDALIAAPATRVDPQALLAGWQRLARRDREAAAARLDALIRARKLSAQEASPYALALALGLAWDRRSESLQYFERVQPADLDDYALEWQARAALWAGDWALAGKSIAAMSTAQRESARWRYWAARVAEQSNDPQLARQLYESVLIDDNFYSIMAAARLGRPLVPHAEKLVRDEVQLKQIGHLPALVRARELLLCDLRTLAGAEWAYGYQALSEEARRQTVHLAASWGWHYQAIATAARQRIFNDYELLYPRPYDREVAAAARLSRLPGELIYSVMRQESLYQAEAVSSAGARGLLQMLPETARRTARRWKRPQPRTADLFEPHTNVTLGAAHLRDLVDRFDGQTVVALAGYNAGPGASQRWLPGQSIDTDVWVENIPYNETRSYVQRILWHSVVFGWLSDGRPQKADTWHARVVPLGDTTAVGSL
jgi:soluble lytic murein transglycosylase